MSFSPSVNTVVTDTSVIIKWLNQDNEKYLGQADKILMDVQKGEVLLIAPELAKYEVGNVLLIGKKLSFEQAGVVLKQFYNLPISFIEESGITAAETFKLAADLGVTYYDASFMTIAKQYNATLVTENIKHQGKLKEIKLLPIQDY